MLPLAATWRAHTDVKYNAVLRGSCRTELAGSRADATPDAALVDVWESLCARNRYPTTLYTWPAIEQEALWHGQPFLRVCAPTESAPLVSLAATSSIR